MNKNIIWPIFISIWALIYSMFEIEVEGKHGWAQNLPVYYIVKPNKLFPLGFSSWNLLMILIVFISILSLVKVFLV